MQQSVVWKQVRHCHCEASTVVVSEMHLENVNLMGDGTRLIRGAETLRLRVALKYRKPIENLHSIYR